MAFPLNARMIAVWQRPSANIAELAKQAPADFCSEGDGAAGLLQWRTPGDAAARGIW